MGARSRIRREDTAVAILFLVWGLSVLAFAAGGRLYARIPGEIRPLRCMFKEVTGLPCATCGTTRTFMLLGQGDLAGAIRMNPFMFFAALAGIPLAVCAVGAYFGLWPFPKFDIPQPWKRILVISLIALFLANWGYLIWSGA